ncbi:zinc-binding dehydrogenase [Candidatus Omnitrophota bacterium]
MGLYPLKFRAAILQESHKPLVLDDIEFSGPLLTGQVLTKLHYSGICGKQIDEIDAIAGPDAFLPHLLGHEGCAEVIDIGPGVAKVKKGDTVVMHWRKGSGIQSSTPMYLRNGSRINAGWVTTFNDYAVVSENRLTPISIQEEGDKLIAALCGCVVTTGVGVIINEARVQPYDTVVIYGCGGVGLCAVQAAAMIHPRTLIAIDVNKKSLAIARDFGATEVFCAHEKDPVKLVLNKTDGKGASKVIVCTGNPSAIEKAVDMTSIPGECFFVGVPPKDAKVKINAHAVMHKRNIRGTLGGDSFPDRDIPAYFTLHKNEHLHLDKLVSFLGTFTKINEAIDMMRSEAPGRCAIKF